MSLSIQVSLKTAAIIDGEYAGFYPEFFLSAVSLGEMGPPLQFMGKRMMHRD